MNEAFNLWWKQFWQTAINNPKTTLSELLSFVAITSTVLLSFQFRPAIMGALAVISALAKAYIGAISLDSGRQLAKLPGSDQPVMVDAHEMPDDPKAKAVK